jgi:hypothetical protein
VAGGANGPGTLTAGRVLGGTVPGDDANIPALDGVDFLSDVLPAEAAAVDDGSCCTRDSDIDVQAFDNCSPPAAAAVISPLLIRPQTQAFGMSDVGDNAASPTPLPTADTLLGPLIVPPVADPHLHVAASAESAVLTYRKLRSAQSYRVPVPCAGASQSMTESAPIDMPTPPPVKPAAAPQLSSSSAAVSVVRSPLLVPPPIPAPRRVLTPSLIDSCQTGNLKRGDGLQPAAMQPAAIWAFDAGLVQPQNAAQYPHPGFAGKATGDWKPRESTSPSESALSQPAALSKPAVSHRSPARWHSPPMQRHSSPMRSGSSALLKETETGLGAPPGPARHRLPQPDSESAPATQLPRLKGGSLEVARRRLSVQRHDVKSNASSPDLPDPETLAGSSRRRSVYSEPPAAAEGPETNPAENPGDSPPLVRRSSQQGAGTVVETGGDVSAGALRQARVVTARRDEGDAAAPATTCVNPPLPSEHSWPDDGGGFCGGSPDRSGAGAAADLHLRMQTTPETVQKNSSSCLADQTVERGEAGVHGIADTREQSGIAFDGIRSGFSEFSPVPGRFVGVATGSTVPWQDSGRGSAEETAVWAVAGRAVVAASRTLSAAIAPSAAAESAKQAPPTVSQGSRRDGPLVYGGSADPRRTAHEAGGGGNIQQVLGNAAASAGNASRSRIGRDVASYNEVGRNLTPL